MATQIAQIVGNNIAYPPQRRTKQQQFGTVLSFSVDVMRHDPELLSEVMALQQRYDALATEVSQRERIQLEEELDALIVGTQKAHNVFLEAERAYYTALSNDSQSAKNELESASRSYDELKAAVDDDEDMLLTKAQQAERVERLKQAKARLEAASLAESLSTSHLNSLNNDMNNASRAEAEWKTLAYQAKSELNNA